MVWFVEHLADPESLEVGDKPEVDGQAAEYQSGNISSSHDRNILS
jgi:hypothetical protein